jgi:glycosyltransferase involved in cell wall biosynthesis
MSSPKLSIITINLNNQEGLRKTIESVTRQTSDSYEYIVIDGASSDASADVIKSFDKHIHFWISEPDSGIYNAMNKGIKAAKGRYLLFLNSGDWLFNNQGIETVLELIDPAADVCSADIYHADGNSLSLHPCPPRADFHYLFNYSLPHPSSLIRRSLFDEFGLYNENNEIASDWEFFFITLIMQGRKYQKIPYTLSVFNLSGVSNSASMEAIIKKERKAILDKYIPKVVQEESISLQKEMHQYRLLQKRVNNRRYQMLGQIETNPFLARILTLFMIILSKLAKVFGKVSHN